MARAIASHACVVYRSGNLYVADFDNGKIRVIGVATFETTTLIAQAGFERRFGMAFAADGTLYVSTDNDQNGAHSAMSGSIWRIDPGAHSAVVIASAIGRPRGLVVLADGRIALTDYMHQVVELLALETIMRLRGGRLRTARSRRSQCWCTSETYEQRCPRSWRLPVRGNA